MKKPKAVMIPFGYPGYPPELLKRFRDASVKHLKRLGIDLVTTPTVIEFADTRKVRQQARKEDFDFVVVLVLSWLEAPNVVEAVRDFAHKPLLLWSHTMYKEKDQWLTLGPIPGATVLRQAFEELRWNFKFVYGQPGDRQLDDEMTTFARAAAARYRLQHSRIGLLGYVSMGMYTAAFDHLSLLRDLGPEIDQIDQFVLVKRLEAIKNSEVKPLIDKARREWQIARAVRQKDLEISLKMYVALKRLAEEREWSALNVKCQYELSKDYGYTPRVPLSMLGNELPCSCEGDVPLIAAQLVMHYLTGRIASYGDVHTVEPDRLIMGACGYAPFDMGEGKPKVDRTTILYKGLANCTIYREGEVTIARLGYTPDRKLRMHVAYGRALRPRKFQEVGCLPYPAMEVEMEGLGDQFAQGMMSQHYGIVYGDIRNLLRELLRQTGIEGVFVE